MYMLASFDGTGSKSVTCKTQLQCSPFIRPDYFLLFYLLIDKPSYCNFLESRKKLISKKKELFYLLSLNIIFVEKNNIFFRFSLCVFESDTVKSDCPIQIFMKMMKYLKVLNRL